MKFRLRNRVFLAVLAVVVCVISLADAGNIDAVRGKQYRLTKRHGPWMIMVAAFSEPPPDRRQKGMTPLEAADELVYELRKKGIPAYAFRQDSAFDEVETIDRYGRLRNRLFTAQQASVCVLAGNYTSTDDRVAQKTLAYVKRFYPKFLRDVSATDNVFIKLRNGGIYRKTPGRPGPLSGAFMTINPLLTPEEASRRQRDPLLAKLNTGMEYSLIDNPAKYTLVVATSYVESNVGGKSNSRKAPSGWFKLDNQLDDAAERAWQLTKALREAQLPVQQGVLPNGRRNFEAYVFHGRHESLVTIGAFDSPNDPEIARLAKIFGAKVRKNPAGQDVLIAEVMTFPDMRNANGSMKSWIFDPYPRLIKVPRLSIASSKSR